MAGTCSPATVHPRPRGEHSDDQPVRRGDVGSSPPARGTPSRARRRRSPHRFIPARAGNTSKSPTPTIRQSVHPRPRGEHLLGALSFDPLAGSSPPARGTHCRRPRPGQVRRFIPARAGNTRRRLSDKLGAIGSSPPARGTREADQSVAQVYAVHPRPRGEHPVLERRRQHLLRFIPARAGNTCQDSSNSSCSIGSSPPARGTLGIDVQGAAEFRFIPARAGNTSIWLRIPCWLFAVHPRPRGEHSSYNALIEKVLLDATKRTSLARLSLDRGERPDF